jgi:protein disulfide-isomerase-like protein
MLLKSVVAVLLVVLAQGAVVTLRDDTFEDFIKYKGTLMIKLYAPWCGHCKKFAPEYEKAASIIKQQSKGYVLADIDCETNPKAKSYFNVSSFPTIKFIHNGTVEDYNDDRTAQAVLRFFEKKLGGGVVTLRTVAEVDKIKAASGLRVRHEVLTRVEHLGDRRFRSPRELQECGA